MRPQPIELEDELRKSTVSLGLMHWWYLLHAVHAQPCSNFYDAIVARWHYDGVRRKWHVDLHEED